MYVCTHACVCVCVCARVCVIAIVRVIVYAQSGVCIDSLTCSGSSCLPTPSSTIIESATCVKLLSRRTWWVQASERTRPSNSPIRTFLSERPARAIREQQQAGRGAGGAR